MIKINKQICKIRSEEDYKMKHIKIRSEIIKKKTGFIMQSHPAAV